MKGLGEFPRATLIRLNRDADQTVNADGWYRSALHQNAIIATKCDVWGIEFPSPPHVSGYFFCFPSVSGSGSAW
jgi:hypothetical protein